MPGQSMKSNTHPLPQAAEREKGSKIGGLNNATGLPVLCFSRKTVLVTGTRSVNRRVQDSPCTAQHLDVETTYLLCPLGSIYSGACKILGCYWK